MALADVHAHLTHPKLYPQVESVVARAKEAGITTIINNGLNPADNDATLALAERFSEVKPALGFYPVDTVLGEMDAMGIDYPREVAPVTAEAGIEYVKKNVERAFAVGEIGLDGYWVPESLWAKQEEVFCALVEIAMQADKAIIIHTRKREKRCFELLKDLGATRVNWHCFGGKVKLARRIADELGHCFSIPANARKSESFTRMLETLPRDQLLFETDCPYLAPTRGAVNEPKNIALTAEYAAELWGCALEGMQERVTETFTRLFCA